MLCCAPRAAVLHQAQRPSCALSQHQRWAMYGRFANFGTGWAFASWPLCSGVPDHHAYRAGAVNRPG